MMNQIFPWKRFWSGRTGSISLDDNGFLLDPESEFARYYHQDVKSFEEIQKIPCLILLGEPGSGKTTALNSEIENLSKQIDKIEDVLFYKNLNEYGDETRLINEVFESQIIHEWLKGHHNLHLFLDSMDECLLEIPKLSVILRNRFTIFKDHAKRLKLRLSCRTGDWPETLTNEFNNIWEAENVGIYELAPLRRKDVIEAANLTDINSSLFIQAIKEREIQSLAINPITLKFLLDEFKNNPKSPAIDLNCFLKAVKAFALKIILIAYQKKYYLHPAVLL